MKGALYLAWRYVAYNKAKTAILTVALTLIVVLPLSAHLLIKHYGASLMSRANATPLVVGAKGNRFDLVLKSLYFTEAGVDAIYMSEVEAVRESGLATPIPLHLKFTASRRPIVGTTLEYFDFRGLRVREGAWPAVLGEAVLGARAAAELGLGPGGMLFSDQEKLYDITQTYPLKMRVVGVLAETGTPDDEALFVDVKTAWLIEGIMHGHQDLSASSDDSVVLKRTDDRVIASAAVVQYNEVTPENIDSFHLHAAAKGLPISAMIVLPADDKSRTLIKARYGAGQTGQMLVPSEVVKELLELVFRVKRFFDANFALISVSTALFLALAILLSHRLRRREMETMHKLGCSRGMAFRLQAAELGIVLLLSAALAAMLSVIAVLAAPNLMRIV